MRPSAIATGLFVNRTQVLAKAGRLVKIAAAGDRDKPRGVAPSLRINEESSVCGSSVQWAHYT